MYRIAFLFMLMPFALSAQEDCELYNIPELMDSYLTTQVDSIVLYLSNGNSQTLNFSNGLNIRFGCTDPTFDNYDADAIADDGSCSGAIMDGHVYDEVRIGDQIWFAENLRTTVYADGSAIPEVTNGDEWGSLSTGARCTNDNNPDNVAIYGRLYNWFAVDNASGLCPIGWRVPSDEDWTELEDYITAQGFSGTEGSALRSTTGWAEAYNGVEGTDDFGFSALPGGQRFPEGYFSLAGYENTYWWTSTVLPDGAAGRRWLFNYDPAIRRGFISSLNLGKSVRCLRDAE